MERANAPRAAVTTYEEYAPSPALRPFVRAFFAYRPGPPRVSAPDRVWCAPIVAGAPFSGPMIASAEASIVLPIGDVCIDGRWTAAGSLGGQGALLVGPSTCSGGSTPRILPAMVGAYLRPGHLSSLLRCPVSELADRTDSARGVLGIVANDILAGLERFAQRGELAGIERALLHRYSRAARDRSGVDIPSVLRSMVRDGGGPPVAVLADRAGVSRQQLARIVRLRTGLTPRMIGRHLRFHRALTGIARRPRVSWSVLAAQAGYADQSHMIREFQRFAGCAPTGLTDAKVFHPFIRAPRLDTPHRESRNP